MAGGAALEVKTLTLLDLGLAACDRSGLSGDSVRDDRVSGADTEAGVDQ